MRTHSLLVGLALLTSPAAHAATPNATADWAAIVQPAIVVTDTGPRSGGTSQILHATVMLAAYDAAVSVEGRYRPFVTQIVPVPYADVRAAVATAAWRTARSRVAAGQVAYLDQQYAAYLATIPEGIARTEGIQIGEAAASAVLAARADDRFGVSVMFECSGTPTAVGEFEPDAGCPTGPGSPQPADVKLGRIAPFTFTDIRRFLPAGPRPMRSRVFADDFEETRDLGRVDSVVRTPEQTDVAYFWAENPYVHWNRNLIALARAHDLDTVDTARLFAMVHTSVSDAIIVGFAAKYRHAFWRPRTAIPRADEDGNPNTDADPTWRPLLSVNHPEYPSGHGFWSTAVVDAVAAAFGTRKVTWTLTTSKAAVPRIQQTERTYHDLDVLMQQIGDARVWAGLHWRTSITHGEQVGRRVTAHVVGRHFRPE